MAQIVLFMSLKAIKSRKLDFCFIRIELLIKLITFLLVENKPEIVDKCTKSAKFFVLRCALILFHEMI